MYPRALHLEDQSSYPLKMDALRKVLYAAEKMLQNLKTTG
jgi:hypothetical protein